MANLFLSFIVAFALFCQTFAAQWKLDTTTTTTVVVGVGTSTDEVASAAASANGSGAMIDYRNADGSWTKKGIQAGLLLDTAVTPSGVVVGVTSWNIFLSTDQGQTYTTIDNISGLSQSANVWGDNKENFALVGTWAVVNPNSKIPTSISGVAYSKDAGKSWSLSSNVPVGYVRYGAFPSENTWYIASGMWADSVTSSKSNAANRRSFPISSRIEASLDGGFTLHSANNSTMKATNGETGWFGAVSKTTDGGKTWTQVFSTDLEKDALYFNGISCSSDSHCAVVAEGEDEAGNYKTVGYVTFDGGVTWTASLTTSDVSLIQVKLISELEGWAAGTAKSGRNLYGQFYHTLDGGKTWKLEQALNNCLAIDMDFALTKGYAACSSSSGASCSVAIYE